MSQQRSKHPLDYAAGWMLASCVFLESGCGGTGAGGAPSGADVTEDPEAYHYRCDLVFAVSGPASSYEEVGVSASFAKSLGTFLVGPRGASCSGELATPVGGERDGLNNSISTPEDNTRLFSVTLDDTGGIALPADVATCSFLASREPVAEDFAVDSGVLQPVGTTPDSTGTNGPPAAVSVAGCTDLSEWSGSTTSTTLDVCATADCADDEICREGLCQAAETGRLEIYLDSATAPVAALQLQVDYSDSGAVFARKAGTMTCTPNPEATGWLYADCDFQKPNDRGCDVSIGFHPGELSMGIVTLQGFEAPVSLANCDLVGEDLDAAVDAMRLESVEAMDARFNPVAVTISMRLTRD